MSNPCARPTGPASLEDVVPMSADDTTPAVLRESGFDGFDTPVHLDLLRKVAGYNSPLLHLEAQLQEHLNDVGSGSSRAKLLRLMGTYDALLLREGEAFPVCAQAEFGKACPMEKKYPVAMNGLEVLRHFEHKERVALFQGKPRIFTEEGFTRTYPAFLMSEFKVGSRLLLQNPEASLGTIATILQHSATKAGMVLEVGLSLGTNDLSILLWGKDGFQELLDWVVKLRATTLEKLVSEAPEGEALQAWEQVLQKRPRGHVFICTYSLAGAPFDLNPTEEGLFNKDDHMEFEMNFHVFPGHEEEAAGYVLQICHDKGYIDKDKISVVSMPGRFEFRISFYGAANAVRALRAIQQEDMRWYLEGKQFPILVSMTAPLIRQTAESFAPDAKNPTIDEFLTTFSAPPASPPLSIPMYRWDPLFRNMMQLADLLGPSVRRNLCRVLSLVFKVHNDARLGEVLLDVIPLVHDIIDYQLPNIRLDLQAMEQEGAAEETLQEYKEHVAGDLNTLLDALARCVNRRIQGDMRRLVRATSHEFESSFSKLLVGYHGVCHWASQTVRLSTKRMTHALVISSSGRDSTTCTSLLDDRYIIIDTDLETPAEPALACLALVQESSQHNNVWIHQVADPDEAEPLVTKLVHAYGQILARMLVQNARGKKPEEERAPQMEAEIAAWLDIPDKQVEVYTELGQAMSGVFEGFRERIGARSFEAFQQRLYENYTPVFMKILDCLPDLEDRLGIRYLRQALFAVKDMRNRMVETASAMVHLLADMQVCQLVGEDQAWKWLCVEASNPDRKITFRARMMVCLHWLYNDVQVKTDALGSDPVRPEDLPEITKRFSQIGLHMKPLRDLVPVLMARGGDILAEDARENRPPLLQEAFMKLPYTRLEYLERLLENSTEEPPLWAPTHNILVMRQWAASMKELVGGMGTANTERTS